MREIEIKAHVFDVDRIKLLIESFAGKAGLVDKKDTYLKNEKGKLVRIRINNGNLESTTKETRKDENGDEDNLEYEIQIRSSFEETLAFFNDLGFEFYFHKYKNGFEWNFESVHIELLSVNDLGWFLEMERLMDFDIDNSSKENEIKHLHKLLSEFGLNDGDIETKSYRSMILDR